MSGSPGNAPGPRTVSPVAVFDGVIIGIPASLVIGIAIALAPELNSPMYASVVPSPEARIALRPARFGVHAPVRLLAELSVTSRTGTPPAAPPACCSASLAPSLIARVCTRAAPLKGRLE